MLEQKTINEPKSLTGKGLFGGKDVTVTFCPAPADHGIVFVRTDLKNQKIPAHINNVIQMPRRTALSSGKATIETTEHLLSAVAGLNIDNLLIEIDAQEVPAMDGSSQPFVDCLLEAGIKEIENSTRYVMEVLEPIVVRDGDAMVAAVPSDDEGMQIVYDLEYKDTASIGRQLCVFNLGADGTDRNAYINEIASARTFVLEQEAKALQAAGFGKHLGAKDILVMGDSGPVGDNAVRFSDEPVRHKVLDLIGDLYLIGAPIKGKIIANKSGHHLNQELARKLLAQQQSQHRSLVATSRNVIDIKKLSRILPHRFPMLLVDRVVDIQENMAVGIKNVTMNEPFFQGHYPGTPIMPGVLIVEAMAQLSGVLIGQNLEHTGKLAILLSLDKVRLRKPVTPGDQLLLEAQAIKVRSKMAHMMCRAYVGQDLVAEAEIKFMLVDDEQ